MVIKQNPIWGDKHRPWVKLRNSVLLLSLKPKFLTLSLCLKRKGTGEVFSCTNRNYPQRQKQVAHLLNRYISMQEFFWPTERWKKESSCRKHSLACAAGWAASSNSLLGSYMGDLSTTGPEQPLVTSSSAPGCTRASLSCCSGATCTDPATPRGPCGNVQ